MCHSPQFSSPLPYHHCLHSNTYDRWTKFVNSLSPFSALLGASLRVHLRAPIGSTICTTSANMNTSDHLFTLPAEFVRAPWAANFKTNTNTNHQRLCLFRRERESWGSRDSHVTGGSQPALQLQAAFVPGRPTPYPYTGCQAVSPHPLHMFRLYTSTTTPSVLEAVLRCTVPCEGIPHTSHFKFPPLILSENKARAKRIWIWR